MQLNVKFPLYAIRANEGISEEGIFTLITTRYAIYVLDCKGLGGNYAYRRTQMLGMELPYKLYPLKERYSTLAQLANTKRRIYIDSEGDVKKYIPQKYYHIKYTRVLQADRTWNGYYRLMTKLPVAFVTEEVSNYIGYIQIGSAFYLYDLSDEPKPTIRKKI